MRRIYWLRNDDPHWIGAVNDMVTDGVLDTAVVSLTSLIDWAHLAIAQFGGEYDWQWLVETEERLGIVDEDGAPKEIYDE